MSRARLLNRFQLRFQNDQSARREAAAVEKATRTRLVQAEAGQALTSATAHDLAETAPSAEPPALIPHESACAIQEHEFPNAKEEPYPSREPKLRMILQERLQVAEDRIGELERQLKAARGDLKESILQDEKEEIQRQRRVIANLTAELSTVEDERDALRKQVLESEARLFELERENGRLRHGQRDFLKQDGDNATDAVHQHGESDHDQQSRPPKKANANPRTAPSSKRKRVQLGRQPGVGLYLMT